MYEMKMYADLEVPEKVLEAAEELKRIIWKIASQLKDETGIYISIISVAGLYTGGFQICVEPMLGNVSKERWRSVAIKLMKQLKKELEIKKLEVLFEEINSDIEETNTETVKI